MDEQRRRIVEDLSGTFKGELRSDPLSVAMYASDGSLYQIAPLVVAVPRHRDDVMTLARYSAETSIPLIARGAGTGVAGQAIGSGIVVDFSRHMRRIESIGEDTVRVEPGIVRDELNRVLREYGRYFPPDPSSSAVTTVGSMLSVDAAGSRSVRVGSTRDHVKRIETVLAGGRCFEFGVESLDILKTPLMTEMGGATGSSIFNYSPLHAETPDITVKRTIISKLTKLLSDSEELIQERQPPLIRNCSGYNLRGVLSGRNLHMERLLVGSEGTLGLFTSAVLHTSPLPEYRGIVLLLFGSLEAAIQAVQVIAPQQPSACDLLDRRLLSLGRESDPRFERIILPAAEAGLIVEQTGFSGKQARDRIRMVISSVRSLHTSAVVAHEAYAYDDVEFLWSLPRKVVPMLTRLTGVTRPQPFVEDVAVPPETLREFLVRAQKVFQKHEVTASLYAHAAAGQLHLRPFLPAPTLADAMQIEAIARDLYQVVFAVGGTISGEHGDGLSRTAFIRSQYGPLYRVFQQVKDVFDPHNLMNPGKIISDDAHVTVRNFRPPATASPDVVDLQLKWSPKELTDAAALCNGCGNCRTQQPDLRMCPFFRAAPREDASPRSKANVMRNIACGTISPTEMASPELKKLADLCFNCKQCQLECPSHVNIPQMMIEAKAAYVAAEGLRRTDWILSRAHSFGELGCRLAPISNWMINNLFSRWFLEKLIGIHRLRKLPTFARKTFMRSVRRTLSTQPTPGTAQKPIVYFVDHYANYHDPELARAFVSILEHHKIPVYVPPDQMASGMAMISAGDLVAGRKLAEKNVRELVELAREGYQIVCTEPAAALCLKHEYPMLLDHPDVQLLADQVIEAGAYLAQLRDQGRLRMDLQSLDLDAGYHTPCHLKALGNERPLRELLNLIPELRVHTIEKGCSGMAGAYGLAKENFRTSMRIGWGLISRMRAGDLDLGITECSSCKMQMEQGTAIPTIHPLKLLAYAYGLMPEIRQKLRPASKRLVVT